MNDLALPFLAAFLATIVEGVETVVILLAVAAARGWRPALLGAGAGLLALTVLVAALGPALALVPREPFHLIVGLLLLLFGAGWLRKAVLRGAGRLARHDLAADFASTRAGLSGDVAGGVAMLAAFKAVLLEGLEVVFVVLAFAADPAVLSAAVAGALIGFALVAAGGAILRRPLSRLPDNAVKFWTGAMLMAFGTYWVGDGVGGRWPGGDLSLVALAGGYAALGGALMRHLAPSRASAAR